MLFDKDSMYLIDFCPNMKISSNQFDWDWQCRYIIGNLFEFMACPITSFATKMAPTWFNQSTTFLLQNIHWRGASGQALVEQNAQHRNKVHLAIKVRKTMTAQHNHLDSIKCEPDVRWLHISRMKNGLFWLIKVILSSEKCSRLSSGISNAIYSWQSHISTSFLEAGCLS